METYRTSESSISELIICFSSLNGWVQTYSLGFRVRKGRCRTLGLVTFETPFFFFLCVCGGFVESLNVECMNDSLEPV